MKKILLAAVRKPFDVLDDVTSDGTDQVNTYSGIRTSQDHLYAITNTQSQKSVYAAEKQTSADKSTREGSPVVTEQTSTESQQQRDSTGSSGPYKTPGDSD
jgi:hypothetical protein